MTFDGANLHRQGGQPPPVGLLQGFGHRDFQGRVGNEFVFDVLHAGHAAGQLFGRELHVFRAHIAAQNDGAVAHVHVNSRFARANGIVLKEYPFDALADRIRVGHFPASSLS